MSLLKSVMAIFKLGVKQGLVEGIKQGIDAGKEQEIIDSAKRDLERIEYEKTIKFEILPYSRMYNLSLATHIRIRQEASEKTELSDEEKDNLEKCINEDQKYYDEHRLDINPPLRISDVLGGWYCEPLKKYLIEKGYRISRCGNDFDLWITLQDNSTEQERAFVKNRLLMNIAKFENGLALERANK